MANFIDGEVYPGIDTTAYSAITGNTEIMSWITENMTDIGGGWYIFNGNELDFYDLLIEEGLEESDFETTYFTYLASTWNMGGV